MTNWVASLFLKTGLAGKVEVYHVVSIKEPDTEKSLVTLTAQDSPLKNHHRYYIHEFTTFPKTAGEQF